MKYILPRSGKQALFFCNTLFVFLLIAFISTAGAHRINLFCRPDNQRIVCSSSYSDGKGLKEAQIKVFSQQNNELLLSGKTDENGKFSFEITEGLKRKNPDLKVSVSESMGHKDTWIINSEEYVQDSNDSDSDTVADKTENKDTQADPKPKSGSSKIDEQEMKKLIQETVSSQLQPLESRIDTLIEHRDNRSFRDIIGGIGYILGIMGILFLIKGRKKRY